MNKAQSRPWLLAAALALVCLPVGPPAGALAGTDENELPGIAVFPGAELISMEGPVPELVDLQRPGWEFVDADILVADYLVDAPIEDLRRFYQPLCVHDPKLLQVSKDAPPGVIISVRHAGRHPLHPRKRWLRIVRYRLSGSP